MVKLWEVTCNHLAHRHLGYRINQMKVLSD